MVPTSCRTTTAINGVEYGLRYVRSSLISIGVLSFGASGARHQRCPIDPRDGEGARDGAQLRLKNTEEEVCASQAWSPRSILARSDQGAPHRHLGRRPERQRTFELGRFNEPVVRGGHAGKGQSPPMLLV